MACSPLNDIVKQALTIYYITRIVTHLSIINIYCTE